MSENRRFPGLLRSRLWTWRTAMANYRPDSRWGGVAVAVRQRLPAGQGDRLTVTDDDARFFHIDSVRRLSR